MDGETLTAQRAAPLPAWRDGLSAVLWTLAIVPQAFGFWLVAGDLAGVTAAQRPTLLVAALLTLGLATLAQVVVGYRALLYEGPAAAYLAAIVVVTAGGNDLAAITGGLLVGGAAVALLGVLRFDRLLTPLFTPLAAMVFVLVVTVAVLPATIERAVDSAAGHRLGTAEAWAGALAVVGCALALGRRPRLRPYALLGALIAGTAVVFALDGVPDAHIGGGIALPELLPWGAPEVSVGVGAPFVVAALLIAFNTIAAIRVVADRHDGATAEGAGRRGLVTHGVATSAGAVLGNVLGTVARIDSIPIADLLDTRRRRALALAAVAIMGLALVGPFVSLVALLPLSVSAALLAFMLGSLVVSTARRVWALGTEARVVALVALAPSIAWTPLQSSLSATTKLLANPMLWGVTLGIVLERALARRGGPIPPRQGAV